MFCCPANSELGKNVTNVAGGKSGDSDENKPPSSSTPPSTTASTSATTRTVDRDSVSERSVIDVEIVD